MYFKVLAYCFPTFSQKNYIQRSNIFEKMQKNFVGMKPYYEVWINCRKDTWLFVGFYGRARNNWYCWKIACRRFSGVCNRIRLSFSAFKLIIRSSLWLKTVKKGTKKNLEIGEHLNHQNISPSFTIPFVFSFFLIFSIAWKLQIIIFSKQIILTQMQ